MSQPTLLVRFPTQDYQCVEEVLVKNQYCLPERFDRSDLVVDVGANIGTFAWACLTRGCGRLLCYEPEADNFQLLKMNMSAWKARAEVYHLAVWRNCGTVKVEKAKEHFNAMHRTLGYDGIDEVGAVSLQEILKDLGPVRMLKLDCEGAERPILDAVQDLGQVQEVVGEMHYGCAEKGREAPTDEWLHDRLATLGFKYLTFGKPDQLNLVKMFWAWREKEDADVAMADHK
jgi:FkbM family methyltransferase